MTSASPISRYRSNGCERRHLAPKGETMTIRSLTPALSVSPQIDPADVVALAASGFRSIVCNRPDGEEAGQPTAAAIAAAAEAHGLRFVHIPVMSGGIDEGDVATMARALADLPAPVLAYCQIGRATV